MIRLAGALLIEQTDEWLVQRRYLSEESMRLLTEPERTDEKPDPERKKEEVGQLNAA